MFQDLSITGGSAHETVHEVRHRRVQKGEILLPGGEVANVIATEVDANFECVIATLNRQVIDQLPLCYISPLWEKEAGRNVVTARPEGGHVGITHG